MMQQVLQAPGTPLTKLFGLSKSLVVKAKLQEPGTDWRCTLLAWEEEEGGETRSAPSKSAPPRDCWSGRNRCRCQAHLCQSSTS